MEHQYCNWVDTKNNQKYFCLGNKKKLYENETNVISSCVQNNLFIYSCLKNYDIYVIDMTTNKRVKVLHGHTHLVSQLCVSNNLIISGSYDTTIRIWNIFNPVGLECIRVLNNRIYVATMHIKDNLVIVGSPDKKIRIWDITKIINGHITSHSPSHSPSPSPSPSPIPSLSISPIPSGHDMCRVLKGHKGVIQSICTMDNPYKEGYLIISCSSDATIRVWDLTRPNEDECIHCLEGHTNNVSSIAIYNNIIISGSWDTTIRIWDITQPSNKMCTNILKSLPYFITDIYTTDNIIIISYSQLRIIQLIKILDIHNCSIIYEFAEESHFWCPIFDTYNCIISSHNDLCITPITLFHHEYDLFKSIVHIYDLPINLINLIYSQFTPTPNLS